MINLGIGLTYEDAKELSDLSDAIKDVRGKYINENLNSYLEKVKTIYFQTTILLIIP